MARKTNSPRDRFDFETRRRETFRDEFKPPIAEKRAAFDDAVRSGGDTLAAWIDYMAAHRIAAAERSAHENYLHDTAMEDFRKVVDQVEAWNTELTVAHRYGDTRPPIPAERHVYDFVTIGTVRKLKAEDEKREHPNKFATRVAQINAEFNDLAAELGVGYRRAPDDLSHILTTDLVDKPHNTPLSLGSIDEKRSYAQALAEAREKVIAEQVDQRVAEFRDHRLDALNA